MNIAKTSAGADMTDDQYKIYRGARVKWPPEASDDIVDDIIDETYEALKQYDLDKDGKKVPANSHRP